VHNFVAAAGLAAKLDIEQRRLSMADPIYITKSDLRDLHALIDQHADERDNAAVDRLAAEIDRAHIVEGESLPQDVVTMLSRVVFENVRTGERREAVLVRPADADAGARRLSVMAPVGAALLGLRVGDTIEWPLPGDRTTQIRILAVEQPVRARDAKA
jgi:regulator of nucleoside diphosphate kinase